MPTVDLTQPAPTRAVPEGTLEALPRRVSLTLPELQFLAASAGDAPLPFELRAPEAASALESRLGQTRGSDETAAYLAALGSLHEPADSLTRRGLVAEGSADAGVLGAIGLLATPDLAVDLDVAVGQVQARAWHRQAGDAVATLATTDGIVFELAWFGAEQWPAELARVAALPEDVDLEPSQVPAQLDLPYELVDGVGEALRSGRADLVPVLVAAHPQSVTDADGDTLADEVVGGVVAAIGQETQGRLRALVADTTAGSGAPTVGVVSWLLLNDGWRSLRAHTDDGERRVELRSVTPSDLAPSLAPVLAEVSA